jgi:hypothetical protein
MTRADLVEVEALLVEVEEVAVVEPDGAAPVVFACTRAGVLDADAGAFWRTRPKIEAAAARDAAMAAILAPVFFFICSIELPPRWFRVVEGMIDDTV